MKKYLLLAFLTISIGIIPYKAYSIDIAAGAATWYMWSSEGGDVDPGFLIGPAMSIKMNNDYNLTFVYLYGKFTATDDDGENYKRKRYDSDLALNYRLNNYFKAFGGLKYFGYKSSSARTEFDAYGPGFGLSCTYPIIQNLFALGTLSGFVLWSTEDSAASGKDHYASYGLNSNLSLAYYIAHESIAVSVGWRYQYFRYGLDGAEMFHGLTMMATYSFEVAL